MLWRFVSKKERRRRQAAAWVARLSGPADEHDRHAFKQWYEKSPGNARAYDRVAAMFEAAGGARRPAIGTETAGICRPRRATRLRYGVAAATTCAALLVLFLLSGHAVHPGAAAAEQTAFFSAPLKERRNLLLVDGSEVLLWPGSSLEVAFAKGERRLRLVRGQGRFSVAHEERPFIVAAEGVEVVALGTRFLVGVGGGRATIALLEGQIEVSRSPGQVSAKRQVTRLRPGERLVVGGGAAATTRGAASGDGEASPPSMLRFVDVSLGEALARFPPSGVGRIRLADPALSRLRLTGAFKADDPAGFAAAAAAALQLEVEQGADGFLLLRARRSARDR